jgi:cyclopropane-fatty-acyl-phospholipid synthase
VAFGRTAALRRELEQSLPERPFAVSFWDGTSVPATVTPAPTFAVKSPRALAHVLRAPGELGIGRAYAEGLIEADDIDGALLLIDNFEAPSLSPAAILRLVAALIRATGIVALPRPPVTELRLRGERHTLARDRRAVRHHYDAGNDFFKLFLDESMTYSCAYWRNGARTLEEAQAAKRELVCTKLGLKAGERLLDVGCGWGSMVRYAARRGVRVIGATLSAEQAKWAQHAIEDDGLAELAEVRHCDYRDVREAGFDAVSSIGLTEHIGVRNYPAYFGFLKSKLRTGG